MRIFPRILAGMVAAWVVTSGTAGAQGTLSVTTTDQFSATECTLGDAIDAINILQPFGACPSGYGVSKILVPAGVYTLSTARVNEDGELTGLPLVTRAIAITGAGPGATIIQRHPDAPQFRLLKFQAPFRLSGVTLRGGYQPAHRGGGAISFETFKWNNLGDPNSRLSALIDNVEFENNFAAQGGALADSGFYYGPYVDFIVTNSRFTNNSAQYGGAIRVQPGSIVTARHSVFSRNRAEEAGGAIYNHENTDIVIEDSTFDGNEARGAVGGAISTQRSSMRLTRSSFTSNVARDGGGAIYAYDTRPVVLESTFTGNRARQAGAINILADGSIEVRDSTFANNVATDFTAGAISIQDRLNKRGPSVVTNSTFSGNQAIRQGGAVFIDSGWLTLNNVTMTGNAAGWGPALSLGWWGGSHARVSNSIFAGNARTDGTAEDIHVDPSEDMVSLGYNVIGSDHGVAGRFAVAGDRTGTSDAPLEAGLVPLADNGGPTPTHALSADSVAIDAGSPTTCEARDQRGQNRPGPGTAACDAGAYEHGVYYALQITIVGNGSVTGVPGLDACTASCTVQLGAGTTVTLTATGAAGHTLAGWSGACAGTSPTCEVTIGGGTSMIATFARLGGDTTTTLSSTPNPSQDGEEVTFIATVLPKPPALGAPSGTVRFLDTALVDTLGIVPVGADGTAILRTAALPRGQRVIAAIYSGDELFGTSASTVSHQVGVVANAAPSFLLASTALAAIPRSAGPQAIPNFAYAMTAGPATESEQQLLGFSVTRVSEIGTISFSAPPAISLDGTLTFTATDGTSGVATFSVVLRDDGGTADGGQDTSAPQTLVITVLGLPPTVSLDISESIGVAEVVAPQRVRMLRITEAIGVADEVKPVPSKVLRIEEAVGVSDSTTTTMFNTNIGIDVTVSPAAGVTVTFATITRSGTTTARPGPVADAPPGFESTVPPTGYDISTTALFTGLVHVCLPAAPDWIAPELFHFESGEWIRRTTSASSTSVCGIVSTLSPFAVFTPVPVAGHIRGDGTTDADRLERFDIDLIERSVASQRGRIVFEVKSPRLPKAPQRLDRFESTTVDRLKFFDDHTFHLGPGSPPPADWVFASGSGTLNGVAGYTYELTATDRGEPGRDRDSFQIVVRDALGAVVLSGSGTLTTGNIQSIRLRP